MFRGMCTSVISADNVGEASEWYADLFGMRPYFVRPEEGPPAYVEFRIGDDLDEFGIVDRRFIPPVEGYGSVVTYWQVDDLAATYADLLARGATERQAIIERGEGFETASVVDPFGNVIGVMANAHWRAQHDPAVSA